MSTATLRNRVLETTTTTGTGALTLGGVPDARYQTFLAALGAAVYTYYAIVHEELNEWEIGVGLVNGDGTLTRSTVIKSTNSNNAVNFSAGTKEVFVDVPAEKLVALDRDSSALTLPGALSVAGAGAFTGALSAGASSSVSAGTDADTDLSIGAGGGTPTAGRTASLTLNAPDSGGFRGAAKWYLKRAASLLWAVGLFSSVAGAMGSVTDLAFAPNPGSTPVAALSSAGALTLAGGLTVSSGGLAVTGASTITGTLGGITTLTATTLTGTLSTAVQPNVTTMAGLTSIGTIGTGAWQGTTIVTTYGGTGLSSWTAGDVPYYSAGTTLSKLAIGANANVVLSQSGGVPAWTAQPTMSVGTDADTTVTFGSGGASPTAGRTVTALLNTPDSGSFAGTARVVYQRAGTSKYQVGIFPSFAGAAQAITDLQWRDGTSTALGALTTGGQLRTSGGFWTTATASLSVSGVEALIGTVTSNPVSLIVNGTQRWQVSASAHFLAYADDSYDIGAVGANRPRTVYVATSAIIGKATSQGTLTTQAADGFAQLVFKNAAGSTGMSQYMASGGTTFVLNVNSKLVTVDNTGALLVYGTSAADPGGSDSLRIGGNATFSSGTDVDTTIAFGTGGGAPTAGRTVTLNLNAPHAASVGSVLVQYNRASSVIWMTGLDANVTQIKTANTDFFWRNGSTYYAALTTGGQLRVTSGFVTKGGAAGAFGTADNFALNFQVNGATVGGFGTDGSLLVGGASTPAASPSINVRTLSSNSSVYALSYQQINTGTSAGVGYMYLLADSAGTGVTAADTLVQKAAAWTNGGAASTFMSKMLFRVLDTNVLTTYLTLDANAGQLTLGATTSTNYSYGGAGSFGGGKGVHFFSDRNTAPTSNPSGGGLLYSESGALKWRGSSGTVTTVAPA